MSRLLNYLNAFRTLASTIQIPLTSMLTLLICFSPSSNTIIASTPTHHLVHPSQNRGTLVRRFGYNPPTPLLYLLRHKKVEQGTGVGPIKHLVSLFRSMRVIVSLVWAADVWYQLQTRSIHLKYQRRKYS